MVDFFDKIYSIDGRNKLLEKMHFYSLLRFIVRILSNIIIPLYYNISNIFNTYSIKLINNNNPLIIVSLTSFPQRINRLWIVIESLLRQKYKPDIIILWLSKNQFYSLDILPPKLLKLQKRGLSIRLYTGDLKAHKKYFYSLIEYPKDIIITVDDDVIYNSHMIEILMNFHKQFPKSVCCNVAHKIDIVKNKISPYYKWPPIRGFYGPANDLIQIGVGGVLFPPDSLYEDAVKVNIFKEFCFYGDDIWLNFMIRLKNNTIVKTNYDSNYLPIIFLKNISLYISNIQGGKNDEQLNSLRNYYKKVNNIDPLWDVIN